MDLHLLGYGLAEGDIRLSTADAGMSYRYRPDPNIVEPLHRTVGKRFRPFASHLVETPPLAVSLVSKGAGKPPRVEMGPPLAVLVNFLAKGELGPSQLIHLREPVEGVVMADVTTLKPGPNSSISGSRLKVR